MRNVWRLLLVVAPAWFPALIGSDAIRSAAVLYSVIDLRHPYFALTNPLLIYVWCPLVVASACLLFLSSGIFLSIAFRSVESAGEWILSAFSISLVVNSVAAWMVQALMNRPLTGVSFAAVVVACSLISFALLAFRASRGRILKYPTLDRGGVSRLLLFLAPPFLLLVVLAPKFYWENFTGDGAHLFESARLLLRQTLPFWSPSAGPISAYPGITTVIFIFPASWFVRLFGDLEASVRLPLLLYVIALYGGVLSLIESDSRRSIPWIERWLIWLMLIVVIVVMAFNATYSPYSADVALPTAQDTLLMAFFTGFVLSYIKRRTGWTLIYALFLFLCSPGAVPLIGLWIAASILIRPFRQWPLIGIICATMLCCAGMTLILPAVLKTMNFSAPGTEHESGSLIKKFRYLQLTDWRRFLYLIVPGGILPAAVLPLWRRHDPLARALTIVIAGYFLFFYVQAYVSLHYFVPVMVLPIIVFWRNSLVVSLRSRPYFLPIVVCAAVGSLLISLPDHSEVYSAARLVGETMDIRAGDYGILEPRAFRNLDILYRLFPPNWMPEVPNRSYGDVALTWNYYAHRTAATPRMINYRVQSASEAPPPNMHFVHQKEDVSLYMRSEMVWQSHVALRPPTPPGSRIYEIPRHRLFYGMGAETDEQVFDVRKKLSRLSDFLLHFRAEKKQETK